ncbi:MAG: sulfatase-like hydrolase/transferase [Planctomycetes bacterium]|nr:sulfatase-like hydrolase/transferase [Planctomycetota bacterium]
MAILTGCPTTSTARPASTSSTISPVPRRSVASGVFTGTGGPCMIEETRLTLPGMLREKGYTTACFGKWHIGMTFFDTDGKAIHRNGLDAVKRIDYSRTIPDGPIHRGFDRFFGTVCCPTTDWLYAWIDGDRIPVPPTGLLDRSTLPKHPFSFDNRRGMIANDFDLEEVDLVFLHKSKEFLEQHVKQSPKKPFFLFHSMQAVHLPSFPADRFKGKSDVGPHGDFIFEMDFIVGELMKTLERLGIAENTLVIFTSDNGGMLNEGGKIAWEAGHRINGDLLGFKFDAWEGGHRVPFLVRWPGHVDPHSVCHQLVHQADLMATCAAVVGAELGANEAEDSFRAYA